MDDGRGGCLAVIALAILIFILTALSGCVRGDHYYSWFKKYTLTERTEDARVYTSKDGKTKTVRNYHVQQPKEGEDEPTPMLIGGKIFMF